MGAIEVLQLLLNLYISKYTCLHGKGLPTELHRVAARLAPVVT